MIYDILIHFIFIRYSDNLYVIHRNVQENFLTPSHLSVIPVEDYLCIKMPAVRAFNFFFWVVSYRIGQDVKCFPNINILIVLVVLLFYSSHNCTYGTVNITIFPTNTDNAEGDADMDKYVISALKYSPKYCRTLKM